MVTIKRKEGFNGEKALVIPQPIIQELERNPISSILHITDIGYYPKALHHFRERKAPINQYVFIYCIDGAGWYRINDQEYAVNANQYFILPAGVAHAYGADNNNPWTIYWIHFKGTLAPHFSILSARPIDIKPDQNSRIEAQLELFEEIFKTLEMGYSQENLLYACSTFYHFLGSLRYMHQYRSTARDEFANNDIVTRSIHFMKEKIDKKLTLADIAEHIDYSPSHFSVLFHKRTGLSPLAYFNQLKIQQACQLLDFTNLKIKQICYKIGIEDSYYFSRLFSKIMGVSPRAYKQMKKG